MYMIPREYVCPKGHSRMFSRDNPHPAPVFRGKEKPYEPVCPVCFEEFIRANVSVMSGRETDEQT